MYRTTGISHVWALLAAVTVSAAVTLAGCRTQRSESPPAPADEPEATTEMRGMTHTPTYANAVCPISGKPIDPENVTTEMTRSFEGKTVAFCCTDCPQAWDKLSDEDKAAKLAAAMPPKTNAKPGKSQTPTFANTRCPITGEAIDPETVTSDLTREFDAKTVAFCCGGCPEAWDKLTDEEKAAKLSAVSEAPKDE